MDKSKGKDNLRAAGKKRLEEFQQKRNKQKGSSDKTGSAGLKSLAAENESLSKVPPDANQFVIESNDLQQKSEGLAPTPAVSKPGDEQVQQISTSQNDSSPPKGKLYSSEADNRSGNVPEATTLTNGSPDAVAEAEHLNAESTANSSGAQVPLDKFSEHQFVSKIDELERQLETLTNEKVGFSKDLSLKSELQLRDQEKVNSLHAEMEILKQELSSFEIEKVQAAQKHSSLQKELQSTNQHLASEVKALEDQAVEAQNRLSLVLGELEQAKVNIVDTNSKFDTTVESLQKRLQDGEVRTTELVEELTTSNKLSEALQEEKARLVDELGKSGLEFQRLDEEKQQIVSELEASNQRVQTLEEHLANEKRTLQHTKELVEQATLQHTKESQLGEQARQSHVSLQTAIVAKDFEIEGLKEKLQTVEAEQLRQKAEIQDYQQSLDQAQVKEEQILAQQGEFKEHLRILEKDKVELACKLETAHLLATSLTEERANLLASLDADHKQHRENDRVKGEEILKLGIQVQELMQELATTADEHAIIVSKMQTELAELRSSVDFIAEEKLKAVQELNSAKEQIARLIEDEGQAAANREFELLECKKLINVKSAENSSLANSLEEIGLKLQESEQRVAELVAELERHRAVSDGLLAEKGTLEAELIGLQEQWQVFQRSAADREFELQKGQDHLVDLQEDHNRISDQLIMLSAAKAAVETELLSVTEQVKKVEDENSTLVKLLDVSKKDLQQLREDSLQYTSALSSEREKNEVLSTGFLDENRRLASELQDSMERLQDLQQQLEQFGQAHTSEVDAHVEQFRDLEEKHTKLLNSEREKNEALSSRFLEESGRLASELQDSKERLQDLQQQLEQSGQAHTSEVDAHAEQFRDLEEKHTKSLNSEREKNEVLSTGFLEESRRLASELQDSKERLQDLQQQLEQVGQAQTSELDVHVEQFRDLEEKHTESLNAVTVCQDEISKLKEEKSFLENELEGHKEEISKLEVVNKDLTGGLDVHTAHLNAIAQEKTVLLSDHASELDRLNEKLRALEESNGELSAQVTCMLCNLEELNEKKREVDLELEAWKEKHENVEVDKQALASGLNSVKDQLQLFIAEKALTESMLGSELEHHRERAQRAEKDSLLQISELEDHKDHLQRANDERVKEIENLHYQVEELVQFQEQATSQLSHLKVLEETSGKMAQEQVDAQSREIALQLDLKTEEEKLQKAMEDNLRLTLLVEHLDGQQHLANVEVADLQGQLKAFSENLANLEVLKVSAAEALFAAEEEARQYREKLEHINLIVGQVEVLQASVTNLERERDDVAQQLVNLTQTHDGLIVSAQQEAQDKLSLQDIVGALERELTGSSTELENHKAMASDSQLHMQMLARELEDTFHNAFPEVGQELLTAQPSTPAEYCSSLATRLRAESINLRGQLRNTHLQFSEASNHLSQTTEELLVVQKDRDMALEVSDQLNSNLKEIIRERDMIEANLTKLEAAARTEKLDLVAQLTDLSQKHDAHLTKGASDSASLEAEVSALQTRIAEQEAAFSKEAAFCSGLQEELKSIVSKLLSGALIDVDVVSKNSLLLDPHPVNQLETLIALLLRRCEDSALQTKELEEHIVQISNASQLALSSQKEDNVKLQHMLQSTQNTLQSRELEMDVLNKRVEEHSKIVSPQTSEVDGLLPQIQRLNEQLETVNTENESLLSRLKQAEQKLSLTREKLSLAVNKGKAVVQQRDNWKESLVEKSKELDLLVADHQEEIELKDAALLESEKRVSELTASVDQMDGLKRELEFLQSLAGTAEQVFLESDDLVRNLFAVLDGTGIPQDWQSRDLVKRILWITGAASNLLQQLEQQKEEAQTLSAMVQMSESKVAKLVADLSLLEQEKEQLVSQFADSSSNHQLELQQMTMEKAQLSGIIRELDLDLEVRSKDNEVLTKRLEDQAADILRFQAETASLQRKLTEEEEEFNNGVAYSESLEGTMDTLVRNLADLHQVMSKWEFGTPAAEPSLHMWKDTVRQLISNREMAVKKLNDVLHQVSRPSHASGQVLHDHVRQILDDNLLSSAVPSDLMKQIEEGLTNIEQQTINSQTWSQEKDRLDDALSTERTERARLQLELTQTEQRLTSVREKLSSAVSKGKGLVHQRDALKQSLSDKNAELETLTIAHLEDLQSKDSMLQEATQRWRVATGRLAELEDELVSSKTNFTKLSEEKDTSISEIQLKSDRAESEAESSKLAADLLSSELELSKRRLETLETEVTTLIVDKEEMLLKSNVSESEAEGARKSATLLSSELELSKERLKNLETEVAMLMKDKEDMQLKCNISGSEAEIARKSVAELSSELELSRERLEKLETEMAILMKDKEDILQLVESSTAQSGVELGELVAEKNQLDSVIKTLEHNLAVQRQERDDVMGMYKEVSHSHDALKSETAEAVTEMATLYSEREHLQLIVAELEMSLKLEAEARTKFESDTEAVVAMMHESTQEPLLERSFNPMTASSDNTRSRLNSLSTLLVTKYEAAVQEVAELSKQIVWLTDSHEKMTQNTLSKQENFENLQRHLASRELELSEISKRMEGVSARAEQGDIAQGLLEETRSLREELLKACSERDALQAELVQLDQKSTNTREKLSLAIKKGKGIAQQRDMLKQSHSELEVLVAASKEELQNKESALERARYEMSMSEEQVQALGNKVRSLTITATTLEHQLRDKENFTRKLETILSKSVFPVEWQSRESVEKLEWLVGAVANAQKNVMAAGLEAETLRKASIQLTSDLKEAQTRAELELESSSVLSLKLEESEGELKWSQQRIAELERHLSGVEEAYQTSELVSDKALNLEAMLQQKQAEVNMAEETVMAWAERFEESERYIRSSQEQISELESKVQELASAKQQIEVLSDKLAKLEESVGQKEAAVKAMEASRGKAVNKLTVTVNKFRELCAQSEGLVAELERMHGSIEEKDAEIANLKEEVAKITIQSHVLQKSVESKQSFVLQLGKQLKTLSQPAEDKEDTAELHVEKIDEDNCLANVNLLQKRLESLAILSQASQADVGKKDAQLQGLRRELEEVVAARAQLELNLQLEQGQTERLQAAIASMQTPNAESVSNQISEIEEVPAGNFLLPSSSPSPHVRGARKPASTSDVAIDVDRETNPLLSEFDDKGHGFKSLASSHFMPRGTRLIAEQIDRFCVGGGRMLMRQPSARLGLTLYWIAIHIWMVFLITAAHV